MWPTPSSSSSSFRRKPRWLTRAFALRTRVSVRRAEDRRSRFREKLVERSAFEAHELWAGEHLLVSAAWEVDRNFGADFSGARGEHQHAIAEEDRFVDVVGDEHDRHMKLVP